MTQIYDGNLPFFASEDEEGKLFAQYGTVDSVTLTTGRPRGFGFVPDIDPRKRPLAASAHGRQRSSGFIGVQLYP